MYLGIDLGTSGMKVLLLDEKQQVIGSHSEAQHVSRPKPLWSEQDPEIWWQTTQKAIHYLREHYPEPMTQIRAIGLSGQMHGATLLDQHNRVLRPAILWNDGRSMLECHELLSRVPDAEAITGNLIMPGFTGPKLLWVQKHEPEIFKQIAKVLLPKDYLRLRLSGDYATDMSDASGTCWLNVSERRWSDEMLAACNLSKQHMPELFEGNEITGTLKPELAKQWGMREDVAIVAGGGDNAASAISVNVITPGSAFLSLGTSGVYFVSDDHYRPNPNDAIHTMCHCLPNLWHEMNVHLSAASCVKWVSKLLNKSEAELIQLTKQSTHKNTPLFLPYLSGERTPHNDPYARGVFFNLNYDTSDSDLIQAVLEGVAFTIAEGQQGMQRVGIQIDDIAVVGGGARSLYWGQIIANAINHPLTYRAQADVGGAGGAARLAWLAINGGDPQQVFTMAPIDHVIEPQPEMVERYAEKLEHFKKLYQNLKPQFKEMLNHD